MLVKKQRGKNYAPQLAHKAAHTRFPMISPPLIYRPLKRLSHEMDLALDDMHGQF
jgi:hypothetical protein